jgi:alkylated DNA repair dioxygenase AlkB
MSGPNGPGPDSGIVNFYQMKDTLMAHADRAE